MRSGASGAPFGATLGALSVPLRAAGTSVAMPIRMVLRVLVVDDDEASRSALATAVRALGHECRSAADGAEAWRMQQEQPADIILSDWRMPEMDGVELCRRVRASEAAYTFFILVTACGDKDHFLRGMEAGADDFTTKPVDFDELRARLVAATRMVDAQRALAAQNVRLRRDSESRFREAREDALTHVANRLRLQEDLATAWARASRYGQAHAIAICDIDNFKEYNDRFGHLAGDEALRRVARAIGESVRVSDSVYRYGGEEFVVIMPEQSIEAAMLAIERLRAAVEACGISNGAGGALTVSAGVAVLELTRDVAPDDWLRRADVALYRAKSEGRNRVRADEPPRAA